MTGIGVEAAEPRDPLLFVQQLLARAEHFAAEARRLHQEAAAVRAEAVAAETAAEELKLWAQNYKATMPRRPGGRRSRSGAAT